MKYYGFHSFVSAQSNKSEGVLYDLLNGQVYNVPPEVVELFSGKTYKSIIQIKERASELGIKANQLKCIISEGITNEIILELNRPYCRIETNTPLDSLYYSEKYPFFIKNITIQPTGRCDCYCGSCNEYINCCCLGSNIEWSKTELNNFVTDLGRFKNMINGVEIYGGNPLLFSNLKKLISELCRSNPKYLNINIPISHENVRDTNGHIKELIKSCHGPLFFTLLILPGMEDLLTRVTEWKFPRRACVYYNHNVDIKTKIRIEKAKKNITVYEKYLLRKDLYNLEWYRKAIKPSLIGAVEFYDFYFRKHFHRCWGYSLSIDNEGKMKPCLWSNIVFLNWKNGKIFEEYVKKFDNREGFWLKNNLGKHEDCHNCIYRYGCNACSVVFNYIKEKHNKCVPSCKM